MITTLVLALSAALGPPLGGRGVPRAAPFDSILRHLAKPHGFRTADFNLMTDYRGPDLRPPPVVEVLLRDPSRVDSLIPRLRGDLSDTVSGGMLRSDSLWKWLGDGYAPPSGIEPIDCKCVAARNMPVGWPLAFHLQSAGIKLRFYLHSLSDRDVGFLRREVPPLFLHHEADTALNAIQAESRRLREDAVSDEVMQLGRKTSRLDLVSAAGHVDSALSILLSTVQSEGWKRTAERLRKLPGDMPVKIGTTGDDVHRLSRGIVFDPGGDDHYEFPDSPRPGTWLMVVDLSGNDEYRASDSTGGAAGFLSLQAIADMGGDDRYLGRDFAFGSALMGYSRLFDGGGNDMYQARCASLGFAFEGVGWLEDRAGNDVYSSYYLSQGAAGTRGLAALIDGGGNDQYLSRPVFVDDLRYRDHFLSLSQGFSTGFSPRHPGGIGILWDRGGEDLYAADIFAQGSGYWFGLGVLMDDAGNDRFLAHQYAQGAGVHFAAGILWDSSGDDLRVSKGVSQGCGHDGGFGLLADENGNDRNLAVDMSLGAGSANGLGIFCDFGGDDVYEAKTDMALGHADMRRDRGSLGFFLDRRGNDRYPQGFGDGAVRRVYDGKKRGHGHGLDAE